MASQYGLKDVADVTFYNIETGEEIKMGSITSSTISYTPDEQSELPFGNDRPYSGSFTVKAFYIDYGMIARITTLDKQIPQVGKLVRLKDRTKKKRIKNKLNKKIASLIGY